MGTGAGERARYRGFGSAAGFDVGQRGSVQELPDSKEPEFTYYGPEAKLHSKITHRRCFAAQHQDLKAASVCLPPFLMLLLQSSATSSTPTLSIHELELSVASGPHAEGLVLLLRSAWLPRLSFLCCISDILLSPSGRALLAGIF